MSKFKLTTCAAAVALGAAFALPAQAAGVKVGVLTCHVASGWGFVLGSSKHLLCNYQPRGRHPEHYSGTIDKYGVDVGYTASSVIIWGVVAPTSDTKPGALEGGYGGVTAQAGVGLGAGANVLIGGFDKSITLQPLSIEGEKGLNVAAGIGALRLKYVAAGPAPAFDEGESRSR
ncbi:MAG: DUF992 domain-containing protein [Alphaproteobacteria bacterium]|nr:DUF992 domain-containing protein [Alphaproteobacteria bacterium]MBU6473213.1 DUF992 domain-containing protein [Alphaproteobacteria bacterium]MDE2011791.1 DUF992 domain-containing protein [Alphaproteobacteria bacterium]MDE2073807.1 DUF992 domain-containing protein [Alphaproteobacteria bacterium]MDE2351966.1 DUF992 domain-containing protein [Alphaproteobacteria bacterium]